MEYHTLNSVIFDLDGTLLDSTTVWSDIDRQILQHYGMEAPADPKNDNSRILTIFY